MITTIDESRSLITVEDDAGRREFAMSSSEGFAAVSDAWLRCGWDVKYVYGFSWMGRPIIQLPDDMVRIQEVIYRLRPDVVVETGIAHGGSLIFYASLMKAMGHGRVVGIDIEIRPHNRAALEDHELFPLITLLEGSSTSSETIEAVTREVEGAGVVLVILDSNHTASHVEAELRAYSDLVSVGSYIVATDGIMRQVAGGPRTEANWSWNNPLKAIDSFLAERDDFVGEEPEFVFNEGSATKRVTYWPQAFLKRIR